MYILQCARGGSGDSLRSSRERFQPSAISGRCGHVDPRRPPPSGRAPAALAVGAGCAPRARDESPGPRLPPAPIRVTFPSHMSDSPIRVTCPSHLSESPFRFIFPTCLSEAPILATSPKRVAGHRARHCHRRAGPARAHPAGPGLFSFGPDRRRGGLWNGVERPPPPPYTHTCRRQICGGAVAFSRERARFDQGT
jgi:hypothetical protein